MTDAEKWAILAKVLAVTVPLGTLIGIGLGWLIGGEGASMAAGAVIGFLVSAGMVSFNVSWALELIPRRWREAPFLVVLLTRSLVWLGIIVIGISLPLLTVAQVPFADLVDQIRNWLNPAPPQLLGDICPPTPAPPPTTP